MSEEAATVAHIDLALVDDCLERFFAVSSARAERYGRRRKNSGGCSARRAWAASASDRAWCSPRTPASGVTTCTRPRTSGRLRAAAHGARRARRRHRPRLVAPRAAERRGSFRDTGTTGGLPLPTAEHRGMSAAVIAGDLALAGAPRFIESAGVTGDRRARLLELLDEAVFASAAGEMTDVDLALGVMPTVDEVPPDGACEDERLLVRGAPAVRRGPRGGTGARRAGTRCVRPRDRHRLPDRRRPPRGVRRRGHDRQDRPRRPPRRQAHHAHRVRRDHRLLAGHRAVPRRSAPQRGTARPNSVRPLSPAVPGPPPNRGSPSTPHSPVPSSPDCRTNSPTAWRPS